MQIRCVDSGRPRLHLDRSFTIRVVDVNEAPVDVSFLKPRVRENLPAFSLAGVAISRDPDNEVNPNRSSVVYILDSDGPFLLNGSDLLTTRTLDHENISSYNVTLTAVDDGDPPRNTTVSVTVYVIDVNDPPRSIRFVSNGVPENSPMYTVVGHFLTDDEDRFQDHHYSIVQVNATTSKFAGRARIPLPLLNILIVCLTVDLFMVVQNRLEVAVNDGLDFEMDRSYTIIIRSTDSGNPRLYVEV